MPAIILTTRFALALAHNAYKQYRQAYHTEQSHSNVLSGETLQTAINNIVIGSKLFLAKLCVHDYGH